MTEQSKVGRPFLADPNENRPGYKQTKVGWIPQGWDAVTVDSVARRATGHTPDKGSPSYWNGGVKWVSLADSTHLDHRWITSTEKEISTDGLANSSACLLPKDTVILLRDASVGKTALLGQQMAVSQHFVAWVCSAQLMPLHLYYWLLTQRRHFERMAVGTTIVTIGMPFFRTLAFPLPPLPEQRKIAAILSTWDDAIEQTRDLIRAKKQQKKALMQQLLTGKRRLPGFLREPVVERLKHHVVERNRRCKHRTHIPVLSVTNDRGFVSQNQQFGRLVASKDLSGYKIVEEGEFAYNPSRINVGSIDILRDREGGLLSPMYVVFAVNQTTLDAPYFRHFCNSYSFTEQVRHLTQGSVRDSLGFDGLAAIKCPLPSLEEQRAIAAVLDTADREIAAIEAKHKALQRQKKGLMQRLLTGQVRVKGK